MLSADPAANLDVDELIELSNYNVTPEFLQTVHAIGITGIDGDALIELVTNGVTIEALRDAHLANPDLDADELVELVID